MWERYNEWNPWKEEYLKSYKFLNSAYKKLADGELSHAELRKLSEEKSIYEHSRHERQALSREVVLQSIKSNPYYQQYKEEIDKRLIKVKWPLPEEKKSFFDFFTASPENSQTPSQRQINETPKKRETPKKEAPNHSEPSIWDKLFWWESTVQPTWAGEIDDSQLRQILRGRKEKRIDKKWHVYWQTMCAKEGAEAFKYLTNIDLPPWDALDKFRNMKHMWWPVQWDGKSPLDVSSIPTSGPFCIGTPSWSAKNAKYGHFITGKDGYVFDAYVSKEPIPIRQYAQMKNILFAYNPKA